MNTAFVWVLTFTILGVNPEHKSFAKYTTKQECERALEETKAEYKAKKKNISGTCIMSLK